MSLSNTDTITVFREIPISSLGLWRIDSRWLVLQMPRPIHQKKKKELIQLSRKNRERGNYDESGKRPLELREETSPNLRARKPESQTGEIQLENLMSWSGRPRVGKWPAQSWISKSCRTQRDCGRHCSRTSIGEARSFLVMYDRALAQT